MRSADVQPRQLEPTPDGSTDAILRCILSMLEFSSDQQRSSPQPDSRACERGVERPVLRPHSTKAPELLLAM